MALSSDDRGVLRKCSICGQMNRQGYQHVNRTIRCAKCHENLPKLAAPVDVASASAFDALVAQSPVPVLVDFWAPWCGPCRVMAPEVEKLAQQTTGNALIVKVDTDAVPELGERFGIRSIPTVAVFKNGQVVVREAGARPAKALQDLLKRAA
ncbi:MAG TPA: thioredoxin [Vicinamibacterales bacterium]|jgi:thioredoxin 2